jgi:hypothetical protein
VGSTELRMWAVSSMRAVTSSRNQQHHSTWIAHLVPVSQPSQLSQIQMQIQAGGAAPDQQPQFMSDRNAAVSACRYKGAFLQRGGRRKDGCATFWKGDRFTLVEEVPLRWVDNLT